MLRRMVGLVALVFVVSCNGDSDGGDSRVSMYCNQVMSTVCNKYVECRALTGGMVFTPAICQAVVPGAAEDCVTENGAAIAAATDVAVDTCIQDLAATACTAICGQIPQDPPSCQMLDPEPSTQMVTCQP